MPSFEFDLDQTVQAIVEGRILARKDSSNRENEYLVQYEDDAGRTFRRWFPEHELDLPEDDEEPSRAANVIPLRASA